MLRNFEFLIKKDPGHPLLNEVLSLNAQELKVLAIDF